MPSTQETSAPRQPVLGHVNLMVDTFIANAALSDLRSVIRATLATSPPSVAATLTRAARVVLSRSIAAPTAIPDFQALFVQTPDSTWEASPDLNEVLRRARTLYGAGMGLAGLRVLTAVVLGASRICWDPDSVIEDLLAAVDADLAQAIVSAKQEIDADLVAHADEPVQTRQALLDALVACSAAVNTWGGDMPFERGMADVEGWKTDQSFGR